MGGPVTSKSKFQGEKPGWLFKPGSEGLGYYTDAGRVLTVHLFPEVAPWGGAQPAIIDLCDLLPTGSPNTPLGGALQVYQQFRACMTHMLMHSWGRGVAPHKPFMPPLPSRSLRVRAPDPLNGCLPAMAFG